MKKRLCFVLLLVGVWAVNCSGSPGSDGGTGGGAASGFICTLGGVCYSCPTSAAASNCRETGPGAASCTTTPVTCP